MPEPTADFTEIIKLLAPGWDSVDALLHKTPGGDPVLVARLTKRLSAQRIALQDGPDILDELRVGEMILCTRDERRVLDALAAAEVEALKVLPLDRAARGRLFSRLGEKLLADEALERESKQHRLGPHA